MVGEVSFLGGNHLFLAFSGLQRKDTEFFSLYGVDRKGVVGTKLLTPDLVRYQRATWADVSLLPP